MQPVPVPVAAAPRKLTLAAVEMADGRMLAAPSVFSALCLFPTCTVITLAASFPAYYTPCFDMDGIECLDTCGFWTSSRRQDLGEIARLTRTGLGSAG